MPSPTTSADLRPRVLATMAVLVLWVLVASCGADDHPQASAEPRHSDPPSTTTTAEPTTTASSSTTTTTTTPPTTLPPKRAVPPSFPVSPTPARVPTPEARLRVLTLGDSTAFTIGHAVKNQGEAVSLLDAGVDARTSTGVTRNDFFDWPLHLLTLLTQQAPPEVAVVSFGANDSQPIRRPDGTPIAFGAPGWREEYLARVDGIVGQLRSVGARVYWVGQPRARDQGYSERMALLNGVYQEVADRYPDVTYLDAWYWLTDDAGEYTDTLPGPDGVPVPLRTSDGIHLSPEGGAYLGGIILNQMLADHGIAR